MPDEGVTQGFRIGGRSGDLFKGAAPYYVAYRRPYPGPVVDYLIQRCGLDGHGRLLDAGCGTGQVFEVMAPYFDQVLAIDPDPDMVHFARQTAARLGLTHVAVLPMRAEDFMAERGSLRMVIFGASFHWMDRRRVGDAMYDFLSPGGYLAVLSPSGILSGKEDWEIAVQEAVHDYLGPDRRAGSGIYREGELHEEALRGTRFERIETVDILVDDEWSIDRIIGFLYSTSYASHSVLGDCAAAFEADIRRRLAALQPEGRFEKTVEYSVIIAER